MRKFKTLHNNPRCGGRRRTGIAFSMALCVAFSLAPSIVAFSMVPSNRFVRDSTTTRLTKDKAFSLLKQPQSHPTPVAATALLSQRDASSEKLSNQNEKISPINATTTLSSSESEGFGESIPYIPLNQRSQETSAVELNADEIESILKRNRIRNVAVAVASFAIAIFNYCWQFTHPVTALEILATMQSQSAPLTSIGHNGKPTVVDFWAPWCENCKFSAPTLQSIEQEYGDRVNFIMVNGDDASNWPLIELFGVDAIPHLALLSGEGDVETALIGPMSRNVLRADIDALLQSKEDCDSTPVKSPPVCHDDLPFKMYDAFVDKPGGRRISFLER